MKKMIHNFSRKITFTSKYISLVMCMLLFLVVGMQSVKAQTYNLLSTAGGTVAGTNYNIVLSGTNTSGCIGKTTPLGSNVGPAGTCTVNFTGGAAVYYVDFAIEGADFNLNRQIITVNGVTHTPSLANFVCNGGSGCTDATKFGNCYSSSSSSGTVSGNYLKAAALFAAQYIYRVSSLVPITQIEITEDQNGGTGYSGVGLSVYIITGLPTPCNAGTSAPTLSATTKANVCPATTVDLTTITASNTPASTSLTWHTGTPATTANKVATPTAVAAGTYYAAFFDATNNCYSGTSGSATTAVTATVSSCSSCSTGASYPGVFPITTNGVTVDVSYSGGNAGTLNTSGQAVTCGLNGWPAVMPWTGNTIAGGSITFTFSQPVNNVNTLLGAFGTVGTSNSETVVVTTNGGTPTLASVAGLCTGGVISSNNYTATFAESNAIVAVTAPTSFTTLTITQAPIPSGVGGVFASVCLSSIIASTPITVGTPAVITGTTGTTVTGNPPTGVSGGTSPYTYSDGTGDALCTAPTSPTLALPAGRITGLVASTGAHSINTTGLGVGTYQYCIKVCDTTGTNCAISKHTIVVTAACNAGSAAPSLIKN